MCNLKCQSVLLVTLFAGVMSYSAMAETTMEEIVRINESIAVLAAQKTELELKTQIATKRAELNKLNSGEEEHTVAGEKVKGTVSVSPASAKVVEASEVMPVVRGIEGLDGKLVATLSYGRGLQQMVRQGEKIVGDWTVSEIRVNSVTLKKGKESAYLSFGAEPSSVQEDDRMAALRAGLPAVGH